MAVGACGCAITVLGNAPWMICWISGGGGWLVSITPLVYWCAMSMRFGCSFSPCMTYWTAASTLFLAFSICAAAFCKSSASCCAYFWLANIFDTYDAFAYRQSLLTLLSQHIVIQAHLLETLLTILSSEQLHRRLCARAVRRQNPSRHLGRKIGV